VSLFSELAYLLIFQPYGT